MAKMKKILVAEGEKGRLREIFNVTYPTVRNALSGKTVSHLGIRIRRAAIERGGIEV